MRIITILICYSLLSGCASTYNYSTLAEPSSKLTKSKTILIATPVNGLYDSKEYKNSGKMTASAVSAAFARTGAQTSISPDCVLISCLEQNKNHGYYVVPEILHWEDRATEWSGIPDRIEIKILIFDNSQKEIASTVISGKSKWLTFGGDHPQDLLTEPMKKFVESLY